jgi:branched-chain amino acid transport system substrate-binding protein
MSSLPEQPGDPDDDPPLPPRRPRDPEQPRMPSSAYLLSELNWHPATGPAVAEELPREPEDHAHLRAVAAKMVQAQTKPQSSARRTLPTLILIALTAVGSVVAAFFVVAYFAAGRNPRTPANLSDATQVGARQSGSLASESGQPSNAEPQLVVTPPAAPLTADAASVLGVSLSGASDDAEVVISGLAPGSTVSIGRSIGPDAWLVLASDIKNAMIAPPRGFVGAMDVALDLRLPDGRVFDRKISHLEWAGPAMPQVQPTSPSVLGGGTIASSPISAASPAAVAQTATSATVRGVTDTEIRFGISAPFSGPAKELGHQMKLGIETAFNQINNAGGVHGRQLRLVAADDGYEPTRTTETMKQLYEKDQVFGINGNVGTPTAAIAVPYALEHRMLFFGAFSGASLLRRDPPDRYVFNYRASYAEETDAVVHYLVKVRRLRPEDIAVFAQQDAYGDSGFDGVTRAMRALRGSDGGTILRLNYKRNTIDVQDAVTQLRARKSAIKAVVMVATYRAAAKFIEKTRDVFPAMIYTNVSFVGSTALADELMLLGPRYAAGVIVTQVVPAVSSYSTVILRYKDALSKYFPGEAPDYVSLEGYVATNVLVEAVKRIGPRLDTERLVDGLESLHDFDLGLGTLLSFGRTEHQGSHKVWGTQLDEAGHYQALELQ